MKVGAFDPGVGVGARATGTRRRQLAWPGTRVTVALAASGAVLLAVGVLLLWLGLDTPLLLAVHRNAPGTLQVYFWSCVTVVGMGWCAVILVLAADRGDGRLAALLACTFLVGTVFTHVPKSLLKMPRPAGTALVTQMHVIGEAFRGAVTMPSGHALTASAMAVLLWIGLAPRQGAAGALLLALAAMLVGVSRVVVGAHWPSDVLVGAGLGLWAAVLAVLLARRASGLFEKLARPLGSSSGQLGIALFELLAAAGLASERTGYPAGRPMVALMAIVAAASAACRVRDVLGSRAAHRTASTMESP